MPDANAAKAALEGNDPLSFLSKHIFNVAGHGYTQSGITDFYIGETKYFYLMETTQRANYSGAIRAHNIKMLRGAAYGDFAPEPFDVKNMSGYRVPHDSDVKLIVTSQLTGCSFVTQILDNGDLLCAHIQPRPDEVLNGKALQECIEKKGKFNGVDNNAFPPMVLGANDYGTDEKKATVFGFKINGDWKFYAQVHNGREFIDKKILELDEMSWH